MKKRTNSDSWRTPPGAALAGITTGIMSVILLIGTVIIVWLLFGHDISRAYDSVFVIPAAQERGAAYITEKYGFEADIVSAEVPDNANMIFIPWDKSDYALIAMSFEGKRFYTAVNRKDENAPICDTYQYDEIENALSDAVEACEPWKVRLTVSQQPLVMKNHTSVGIFFNKFFTGDNLDQLNAERPIQLYVRYYDTELQAEKFDPLLTICDKADIVSYTEDEDGGSDELISAIKISDGKIEYV